MTPVCIRCGGPVPRRIRESIPKWHARKYCGVACHQDDQRNGTLYGDRCAKTGGRLEDIHALLAGGESPAQIATTLGIQIESVSRWLRRHDQPDLARLFERGGSTRGPARVNRRDPYDQLADIAAAVAARDWAEEALCAQVDPDLWFPEKGGPTAQAKAVCQLCPVRRECLQEALDANIREGIWGGLSTNERRLLKGRAA